MDVQSNNAIYGNGVKRIVFRTDASIQIGFGHVMRCLTLADTLREAGARCLFICREHLGHLAGHIIQRGHEVALLPTPANSFNMENESEYSSWLGSDWKSDANETLRIIADTTYDWLVVDHYALDSNWEMMFGQRVRRVMVVDDLANRPHCCDLLLDQNLGRSECDYDGLLTSGAETLIGPKYALLRAEFAQWRKASLSRRAPPRLNHILISMGGVDEGNMTGKILRSLRFFQPSTALEITVVMGSGAPWVEDVRAQATKMRTPTRILVSPKSMAELMASADLAIGAAGGSAWERCALGLPTLMILTAENQKNGALALQEAKAATLVSCPKEITSHLENMEKQIGLDSPLSQMSLAAAGITNGEGAGNVVCAMSV